MVYLKFDGTYGFSWRKQRDYLKQFEPDNVTGLLEATLFFRKLQYPAQAGYYQELYDQLSRKIDVIVDKTPNFGDAEEQQIARDFIKENNLEALLENDEEDIKTRSFWCSQCDDFTDHRPLDDDHTYCLVCNRERESALRESQTQTSLSDLLPQPQISDNLLTCPKIAALLQPSTGTVEELTSDE